MTYEQIKRIKKGLGCFKYRNYCKECPYQNEGVACVKKLEDDLIAYIEHLESECADKEKAYNDEYNLRKDLQGKWAKIKTPKIITLCGSTKFKDDFERINKELTLQGNIVISVGVFVHGEETIAEEQKQQLDELHKRKIDLADAIYVINKGGYIGSSTKTEIEYATNQGKEIIYMEGQYES